MKILELRLKNLNSLYGEWVIDFTHSDYMEQGIFALTGPTGAGKSTILDAMCLALYGMTPRLGKITKSSNEIMSRQAGECYAEVVFESQAGRYRCHWEHRKARKSPDGKLQEPEHQIAHAETGELIESKKSLIQGVIEEKTGMDFDRFTRSMLLAQGGFDSFLKAGSEEKSKILEQITGTVIYTDISLKVHERQKEEKDRLALLKAEMSGVVLLSKEEEQHLQDIKLSQEQEQAVLKNTLNADQQALLVCQSLTSLQRECEHFSKQHQDGLVQQQEFAPYRVQLNLAEKASLLESKFVSLTSLRTQLTALSQEQHHLLQKRPSVIERVQQFQAQWQGANSALSSVKEQLQIQQPLLKQVRELDVQIQTMQKSVSERRSQVQSTNEQIRSLQQQLHGFDEQHSQIKNLLDEAKAQLQDRHNDGTLASQLGQFELLYEQWRSSKQDSAQRQVTLDALTNQLRETRHHAEELDAKYRDSKNTELELQQKIEALGFEQQLLLDGKLPREYETELETLQKERFYLSTIATLEQHRQKLMDGEACPLCGSLEHPFATGNVPFSDDLDEREQALRMRLQTIRLLEEQKVQLQQHLQQLHQQTTEHERNLDAVKMRIQQLETQLADNRDLLDVYVARITQHAKAFIDAVAPWQLIDLNQNVRSALEALKERSNIWQVVSDNVINLQLHLDKLVSEVLQHRATLEAKQSHFEEQSNQLDTIQLELSSVIQTRQSLFQDKSPEQEELRLQQVIQHCELTECNSRQSFDRERSDLTKLEAQLESIVERLQQTQPNLELAESEWQSVLPAHGFEHETAFLNARLSEQDKQQLQTKMLEIEKGIQHAQAMLNDRKARYQELLQQRVDGRHESDLNIAIDASQKKLQELNQSIAQTVLKLELQQDNLRRLASQQRAFESQQKEVSKWERLHSLIGSADGKKFRNFAQGLTFELMVSHANRQLEKMTDRYLLIRDQQEPLALNVIDNYQAADIRSTKNLSGGESFIISLSLALGLSSMSSRNVRVDSLFLDEGFGTLDEDALQVALDTLSALHGENKLIGIISHVAALKDRITTQIQIQPRNGGRSTLKGPGCLNINQ